MNDGVVFTWKGKWSNGELKHYGRVRVLFHSNKDIVGGTQIPGETTFRIDTIMDKLFFGSLADFRRAIDTDHSGTTFRMRVYIAELHGAVFHSGVKGGTFSLTFPASVNGIVLSDEHWNDNVKPELDAMYAKMKALPEPLSELPREESTIFQ
jgi:hypothetical protein